MALMLACLVGSHAARAAEPRPLVETTGPAKILFDPAQAGCDGNDVPDAPARAFRTADGAISLFGLHYTNHFLKGPSLDALKIVCRSALLASGDPDPAAYDDKSWIAATWTTDGRVVDGLVHHEYQGNTHPGRCRFPDYMQCWFNTVLAVRSTDGGATFTKAAKPVVASAPFPQSIEQGRHRGFFNPSNLISDGTFVYFLASTTGWTGQDNGVCLFRTADPSDATAWRAYDGNGFTVRMLDPYRLRRQAEQHPCAPLAPFPAPVGSVVRQRGTGLWLAVFQASADATLFPVAGFYTAASRDLVRWSAPRLLRAGATNYDDPCRAGPRMIAYPGLIDPEAQGRNFDDIGPTADLLFVSMAVKDCAIGERVLMRQPVRVRFEP